MWIQMCWLICLFGYKPNDYAYRKQTAGVLCMRPFVKGRRKICVMN